MCNREAPEVEQFAREHGDQVEVIGVSSQPAALMLAPDGTSIDGWLGMFPIDRVLEYAEEYSA